MRTAVSLLILKATFSRESVQRTLQMERTPELKLIDSKISLCNIGIRPLIPDSNLGTSVTQKLDMQVHLRLNHLEGGVWHGGLRK